MKDRNDGLISTRATLLVKLRNWQDDESWRDFFQIYWRLIYGVARKAGLNDAEAQDVVQETFISVAKHMPNFKYDPAIGSFKSWLLQMTRWRIIAHLRKRQPYVDPLPAEGASTANPDPIANLPDQNVLDLDSIWEGDWRATLVDAAMESLKRRSDPQHYQIFDFYVKNEWTAEKVAERFSVTANQVYQIKHRLTEALRAEVARLEAEVT